MSTERNKAIVRRILTEGISSKDLSAFDELLDPVYINYDLPAPAPGPEGFKQVIAMFQAAFPDLRVTVEEELADGDKVVTRGLLTGTHQGDFMGIPPTGKQVRIGYIDIWRIANGKAVENWVRMDQMSLMQQLGVVPGSA